jgi:hypothetical protein
MSLGEVLVVAMVALLVMKPNDIAVILKKIQQLKAYLTNTKSEILSYIDKELQIDKNKLDNLDELNFYLQKIISITGNYEGDYSIKQIKKRYHELVKREINEDKAKDKK